MIHTIKGFLIVTETEVDVLLEYSCFFYDPTDVGNLISGSFAFPKLSLYIWNFSVHVLLKPSLKDLEHNLTSMWNEHNCMVVWTFTWLPWWLRQERIHLQCRRPEFDPWIGNITWRRAWLPTPVFSPVEFHGQKSLTRYSPWSCNE